MNSDLALAAFSTNAWWCLSDLGSEDHLQLSYGYFIWWLSFLLLGVGMLVSIRRRQALDTCGPTTA